MSLKKQSSPGGGCVPLAMGLLIGILISYGIRLIFFRTFICKQHHQLTLERSYSGIFSLSPSRMPDQVVNLAYSNYEDRNKHEKRDSTSAAEKEKLSPDESARSSRGKKVPEKEQKYETKMCLEEVEECKMYQDDGKKRRLLFVGVMTANTYLESRAKAVWNTWAREIPGKVVFFTGGNEYHSDEQQQHGDGGSDSGTDGESKGALFEADGEDARKFRRNESQIPLVPLPGVDDSYPPQKKSFMMLKYMYDNYGNDFEWFMRADDDVYVRSGKLSEFLRSIDSRHLYFIGQAGKGNQVEKGTLNLAHNENFCMGGPGIILSRPTLGKVALRVQDCLKDMYSTHEDVEVGRCVQRYAGISCTWAYEMQTIFHHNSSGDLAFTGKLKRREVHKAITLHPIKSPQHLYRLHAYFKGLKIQELQYEKIEVHRDLLSLQGYSKRKEVISQSHAKEGFSAYARTVMEEDYDFNTTGLEVGFQKYKPEQESHILEWDFLGKGVHSSSTISPKHKNTGDGKEALEDVVRELMDIINGYSRVRGRVIDFKEILYGYRRVNPLHGVDYILDLFMTYKKYRGRKMTIPVRRHIYLQRPFGPLQIRSINKIAPMRKSFPVQGQMHEEGRIFSQANKTPVPSVDATNEVTKMIMIVPLSGRYETFQRFLDSFCVACLDIKHKVKGVNTLQSKIKNVSRPVHGTRVGNNDNFFTESSEESTFSPFDVSLIVVFFGTDVEKEKFLELVKQKRASVGNLLNTTEDGEEACKIKMVQIDGPFSRGIALETGISQCDENDLLFLIDVDLTFTAAGLRRVHYNTEQNHQVYFPVVFSQYNPKYYESQNENNGSYNSSKVNGTRSDGTKIIFPWPGEKSIRDLRSEQESSKLGSDLGYWREFGYGIAAFYKSDFRAAGGFDTSIKGWGKEDVALFDRFVHHTNLTIFRAPDPDLVHVFHPTDCDKSLPRSQFEMCSGSQASTLGSPRNLMRYILRNNRNKRFQYLFE